MICECGADLEQWRDRFRALTRPSPGAVVLPLSIMRKLSPKARRELSHAISRARDAERAREN